MQIVTAYQAEIDYRREQIAREWRPLRSRRAARAARNQVSTHDAA